MITKHECGTYRKCNAEHLVPGPHVADETKHGQDIGGSREDSGSTVAFQSHLVSYHFHGPRQIFLDQVNHGKGSAQHNADIAGNLQCSELIRLICDNGIKSPATEHRGEKSGEIFNNAEDQHQLERGRHKISEVQKTPDHDIRNQPQTNSYSNTDNDQGDEIGKNAAKRKSQNIAGFRVGRHYLPHLNIGQCHDYAGGKYSYGDAQNSGHDPQCHILVFALMQHRQPDRNGEHYGGPGHVTCHHCHYPGFAGLGQSIRKLISSHVNRYEGGCCQSSVRAYQIVQGAENNADKLGKIGNGCHDAGHRHENGTDTVQPRDEFSAQSALLVAD